MKKTISALALVIILASIISILRSRPTGQDYDPKPAECLGARMAEEVANSLHGEGRIVVLSPDPEVSKDASILAQWKGFKESLESYPNLHIDGIEAPSIWDGDDLPPQALSDLIRYAVEDYPDSDAIVSFIGMPDPAGDNGWLDRNANRLPPLMGCQTSSLEGWRKTLETGMALWVFTPNWEEVNKAQSRFTNCDDFLKKNFFFVTKATL